MRGDSNVYSMPSCMYSSGPPHSVSGQAPGAPNSGLTPQVRKDCVPGMTVSGRITPDEWYVPFSTPLGGATMYDVTTGAGCGTKKGSKRSTYKHVPHREKPPHLVQRRNARERRRVQAVNNAFVRLRRHIPHENKNKRLSKVKTLRIAIDYINQLQQMITEYDAGLTNTYPVAPPGRSRRNESRLGMTGRRDHMTRAPAHNTGYDDNPYGVNSKENTKIWINMNFRAGLASRTQIPAAQCGPYVQ